ncbi:hypothetical protein CMO84_06870 [Candidatus Woesearchaeota archaeon]|jgi:tetratricopeptide (TPR) repeat protein|nr:hypothetical protein [Candidatus Woesearchaeota archaeon]
MQEQWLQVNPRGGVDIQARHEGLRLVEQGRGQEAVDLLSAALAEQDNLSTRTVLGMALASTGQAAAAASEFKRVLAQDSARPDAAFQLASLLVGPLAGDNDTQRLATTREAEALLRSALVARPKWAEAHFNLGVTLLRQLRFGEALSSVDTALGLADPQAPWRSEAQRVQEIARARQGGGGNQ